MRLTISVLAAACYLLTLGCSDDGGGSSAKDTGQVQADGGQGQADTGQGQPDTGSQNTGAALIASLAGQWHGRIGPGYKGGCLCLTLDAKGNIIAPSGITLNFDVTDNGGTTVLDLAGRKIRIRTKTAGAPFDINAATVAPDGKTISGQWESDPPGSQFDDPIELDRDPKTCKERTGLSGAPC